MIVLRRCRAGRLGVDVGEVVFLGLAGDTPGMVEERLGGSVAAVHGGLRHRAAARPCAPVRPVGVSQIG
jgi:hypothetical protein